MIKDAFKVLVKYLLVFLAVLAVFFTIIILYNLLPLFKLNLSDSQIRSFLKIFIIPAFFHSFFNALIISISLFGVSILNYHRKYRVIIFLIPLILSTFFVYLFFNYSRPKKNDLVMTKVDDARLFLTDRSFFENNGEKFYFEKIEANSVKKIISVNSNAINFYPQGNVVFLKDSIRVVFGGRSIDFKKDILQQYHINRGFITTSFFSIFYNVTDNFFYSSSIYSGMYLWFSVAFFLLSLTLVTRIKKYPLLSIIYNLFFLILFYNIFDYFFTSYQKYSLEFFTMQLTRELFFSSVFLAIGLIASLIYLAFLKSRHWEE